MTQWDFQNKGKSGWTGKSSFVFEVPLRHLRPSVIYSVTCDRILQRAYYNFFFYANVSAAFLCIWWFLKPKTEGQAIYRKPQPKVIKLKSKFFFSLG